MGVVSYSRIYVRKGGLISSVGVIAVGNCAPCLQLETTVSLSLVRAWRRKLSVRHKTNEGTKGAHCVTVYCTIQRCHVCLSVHPFASNNSAPTGRIFMKFNICAFFENLSKNSNLTKLLQE